ncbi:MAG: tRNA (N6-isopentenyl adenosine(37)-C2)-methylthiotransferase MiaB [Planctomycetaceae bacterium]|nr:tRNA (N6-isopentenyl adenosine(37)-C2)-methylthiotransferase MiaB [Planctomycetaceae bacterium]
MPDPAARTVFLETFGCQMNVLDSELVTASLTGLGYRFVDDRTHADVVLYNTCSVRQHAEDKVHGRLGDAKNLKRDNPDLVLGVIGCMAERQGESIIDQYPYLDLLCGPGELDKIPLLIDNVAKTRVSQVALQGNTTRRSTTLDAARDDLELLDLGRSISADRHQGAAYVRITRGCNKFCTYCVVPFTRGAEVHRPPDHIVEECKQLADVGVVEITLLGQTVNHYRYDHGASTHVDGVQRAQVGPGLAAFTRSDHRHNTGRRVTTFADLLNRIHDEVPAIQRLRFVTSFPRDFGDEILQVMADSPRICDYLHVPVQHGSNRLLKMMNRDYTVESYVDFLDRVRAHLPHAQLATDFIVGFPTETEADFQSCKDLIRRGRFKNSFIFKYSPRPGTTAIDRYPDDVSEADKRRRNNELLAVQAEISQEIHTAIVGQTVDVLVESVSRYAQKGRTPAPGRAHAAAADSTNVELRWESAQPLTQLTGRTRGDLIVMFDGEESLIGQIVNVQIQSALPLTLFGRHVENQLLV